MAQLLLSNFTPPGSSNSYKFRAGALFFGTTSGSGTAMTVSIPGVTEYYTGLTLILTMGVQSANGCTLQVNNLDPVPMIYGASQTGTYFTSGATYIFVYDGTNFKGVHSYNDNTTYSAEKGITLSNGKFGHTNSITAKTTYNQSTASPGYGGTFKITEPKYDAYGHITGVQVATITMPSAQTIPTSLKNPKALTVGSKTYDGSSAVTISAADLGLSNALHFIGVKDAIPTTGTYVNGDVILVGNKEYVYSNGSWIELGDESSFALKTITISGSNGLTGSGTLSGNITLSHADTSTQGSISASGRRYITGVTLDTYGHVTGLTTGTETVTDTHYTTKLFATGSSGTAHAATTNGNTYLRLFDNSTARQSIKIIGSGATTVTSDANGVITISSTDNNTTYSAGTGLTLDGTVFKVTSANVSTMMNLLSEGTSPAQQNDYLIAQYAGGGTTTTTYHRRKVSNIITADNVKKALGTGTGTTKYLREDGTWVVPPNSNSAHSHSAGVGLTGSGNAGTSGTYTYKVNLVNETVASNAASYTAGGTSKFYAVQLDKNNKLGVYVPWTDNNTVYTHPAGSGASKTSGFYKFSTDGTSHISGVTAVTKADITALGIPAQDTTYGSMSIDEGTTGTSTTNRVLTAASLKGIINAHAPTKTGGGASGTWGIGISGNAATATKLATARTIFGKSFDGTGNVAGKPLVYGTYTSTPSSRYTNSGIEVRENGLVGDTQSDIGYAPSIGFHWHGRIAASLLFHNDGNFYLRKQDGTSRASLDANLIGNASTASKLATARTISLTGSVTGSGTFDGSGDLIIATTTNHSHSYLPLAGGTMTGQIKKNTASSWIGGRDAAIIRSIDSTSGSFHVLASAKTPSGSWEIGSLGENFRFSYVTDTNYNAGTNTSTATVYVTNGGVLMGAAWNDYAEYRICREDFKSGQVVLENGDDTLSIASQRLQRGCSIISDTFGFAIGETDEAKCPIAVSGRVLAYGYESREKFKKHIGWPVCSGPNGTVSIMTEEEEEKYPSRIIGTISAVPDYKTWGTGNVEVNNRIWIKIK